MKELYLTRWKIIKSRWISYSVAIIKLNADIAPLQKQKVDEYQMEKKGGILLLTKVACFCEIHEAKFLTLYR